MSDLETRKIPGEAIQAGQTVVDLLGDSVIGAYLFGSAVTGGLRPDSDVDLLVLVKDYVSEKARTGLVNKLMQVSGQVGNEHCVRPLELTVVRLSDVVPWRYPPKNELVYGEWLRAEFEKGRITEPAEDPDLAILLRQVRESGVPLLGPDATAILDPIPVADVRRAIQDSLPAVIESLPGDERNVVLTLARMWLTAATGELVSKDAAAEWAINRLPEHQAFLLQLARRLPR